MGLVAKPQVRGGVEFGSVVVRARPRRPGKRRGAAVLPVSSYEGVKRASELVHELIVDAEKVESVLASDKMDARPGCLRSYSDWV